MGLNETIEMLINIRDCAENNKDNYSVYGGYPSTAEKEIEACNAAIDILKKLQIIKNRNCC